MSQPAPPHRRIHLPTCTTPARAPADTRTVASSCYYVYQLALVENEPGEKVADQGEKGTFGGIVVF